MTVMIRRTAVTALALLATVSLGGQSALAEETTEARDLDTFTRIVIKGAVDISIVAGEKKQLVEITTESRYLERVETEVDGDTLTISQKGRRWRDLDVEIEISIPDGAALALKTWNPRLGIVGGLSILGTTGVVIPFSCSAWIHSIHRGIDVARASNLTHVAACTGSTSERAVQALHALPDIAMLDMGDFAGGVLKYLRAHPVPRLTIGGGFGKLCKLGAGHLDLHSGRSQVDLDWLAETAVTCGGDDSLVAAVRVTHSAGQALALARTAGVPLADAVAARARQTALSLLRGETTVEVIVIDRAGQVVGQTYG